MHVYQLNEFEWWMAPSLEAAIDCAMKTAYLAREDVTDETCHELTDAELDKLRFVDADEPGSEEPEEGWPSRSFREELNARIAAGCEAEMFATSEW